MRICTSCKQTLFFEMFGNQPGGRFGKKSKCKECLKKYKRDSYKSSAIFREKAKIQSKRYKEKYPEKYVQNYKNRTKRTVETRKRYLLKLKYGISLERLKEMADQQKNACAICEKPKIKLVVDHDHKTGKVRSLVCNQCNTALGLLKEDVFTIKRLVGYIEFHTAGSASIGSSGSSSTSI